jgi:hypothetical protein
VTRQGAVGLLALRSRGRMDHGLRGDDMRRNSYAVGFVAVVVVLTLVSHVPVVGSARAESASSSSIEAAAADAVVDDRVEVGGPAVSVMFQPRSTDEIRLVGFVAR